VISEEPSGGRETNLALAYLAQLEEATMTLAWGSDKAPEDRRRIVVAATIFGRQFEERMKERASESLEEKELQSFLMSLLNAVVSEFADREGLDLTAATEFLGDVGTRDMVLEFNEVLENFAAEPEKPLDEHLQSAVQSRREKAIQARHQSSG
jgi:hypothetical protein